MGFVTTFSLDFMHLISLGVMRRLLNRLSRKSNINTNELKILDTRIAQFSQHVLSDFNRKLSNGLNALSFWKATELRLFLLYAGMIVLRFVIPDAQYKHFLYFSIAMRILLSDTQITNVENASTMLLNFVETSNPLYGSSFISNNVHSMVHLVCNGKFG